MTYITAVRWHDFSYGHRVYGHESKCAHFHGHNGRVHFWVEPELTLDPLGRVLDFSVINTRLCQWVEYHWDHRFLIWDQDPLALELYKMDPDGVAIVGFNPTAELMAQFLLHTVGPAALLGLPCRLHMVKLEETRKCCAVASLGSPRDESITEESSK